MNVVYTFDDEYADIAAVSVLSLLKRNSELRELDIYIVDCGISEKNKKRITEIVRINNRQITFCKALNLEDYITLEIDCKSWSMVCFVRLFYASILPSNLETVIHIDCDTLIMDELINLDKIDLSNHYCAACYDCTPKPMRQLNSGKKKYYSNGLFMINLTKWRNNHIEQVFLEYIKSNYKNLPHLDQDVINGVLGEHIKLLPANYNVMPPVIMYGHVSKNIFTEGEFYYTKEELNDAEINPIILHITGNKYYSRPWMLESNYPYTKEWRQYANEMTEAFNYRKGKSGFKKMQKMKYVIWSNMTKIKCLRKILFLIDMKM